jgi:hypothetical protein
MTVFKPDSEELSALGLLLEIAIINSKVTEEAIKQFIDSPVDEEFKEIVNADPEEETN